MGNTQPPVTQGLGEMGLQDYLSLAKRRIFWIIFPALAVLIAATVMAWSLPNIYRCEAVILVQPQKVPTSYFPSTVTSGMSDRMSTIYQEVTSPSRLKRIIDTLNLYPDIRAKEGEQYAMLTMAKAISVEQVTAMGAQAAAYRISYKGKLPAQTAQVTNQITAMFIEENLRLREEQSYGTSDFLESELQKTQRLGLINRLRHPYHQQQTNDYQREYSNDRVAQNSSSGRLFSICMAKWRNVLWSHHLGDGSDESITALWNSFDIFPTTVPLAQRLTQYKDVLVEISLLHNRILPYLFDQCVFLDQVTCIL